MRSSRSPVGNPPTAPRASSALCSRPPEWPTGRVTSMPKSRQTVLQDQQTPCIRLHVLGSQKLVWEAYPLPFIGYLPFISPSCASTLESSTHGVAEAYKRNGGPAAPAAKKKSRLHFAGRSTRPVDSLASTDLGEYVQVLPTVCVFFFIFLVQFQASGHNKHAAQQSRTPSPCSTCSYQP